MKALNPIQKAQLHAETLVTHSTAGQVHSIYNLIKSRRGLPFAHTLDSKAARGVIEAALGLLSHTGFTLLLLSTRFIFIMKGGYPRHLVYSLQMSTDSG